MSELEVGLTRTAMAAAVMCVFAVAGSSASAEDRTVSAGQQVVQEENAALATVAGSRAAVIADLIATWQPTADAEGWDAYWVQEFTAALQAASDGQLLGVVAADSYGQVQTALRGASAPILPEGLSGAQALGDQSQDLVFTPVTPCRIFDTRSDADGTVPPAGGNPGTVISYFVHGTGAQLGPQGGNSAGCTSPGGEPSAIAANFTVVPVGKGHIRAWPFGAAQPNASFLNYNTPANTNLANAGIIATGFLLARDLNVSTWFGTAHSLADVMGYFYPADDLGNLVELKQGGYDINQTIDANASLIDSTNSANHFQGAQSGNTTLTLSGGETVMVMASAQVYKEDTATPNNIEGEFRVCYENTAAPNTITLGTLFQGQTDFCFTSTGRPDQRSVQVSGLFTNVPAGTYRFGFCAKKGSSNSCYSNEVDFRVAGPKINVIKIRQ